MLTLHLRHRFIHAANAAFNHLDACDVVLAGVIPTGTFLLGIADLVFVALFALFLWSGPR